MTKKEQAVITALQLELAMERGMRRSPKIDRDIPIPTDFQKLSRGWDFNTYQGVSAEKYCSSSCYHGHGWDKTSSQRPKWLYSTEALAMRAGRHVYAEECAKELARIDARIAELESAPRLLVEGPKEGE